MSQVNDRVGSDIQAERFVNTYIRHWLVTEYQHLDLWLNMYYPYMHRKYYQNITPLSTQSFISRKASGLFINKYNEQILKHQNFGALCATYSSRLHFQNQDTHTDIHRDRQTSQAFNTDDTICHPPLCHRTPCATSRKSNIKQRPDGKSY